MFWFPRFDPIHGKGFDCFGCGVSATWLFMASSSLFQFIPQTLVWLFCLRTTCLVGECSHTCITRDECHIACFAKPISLMGCQDCYEASHTLSRGIGVFWWVWGSPVVLQVWLNCDIWEHQCTYHCIFPPECQGLQWLPMPTYLPLVLKSFLSWVFVKCFVLCVSCVSPVSWSFQGTGWTCTQLSSTLGLGSGVTSQVAKWFRKSLSQDCSCGTCCKASPCLLHNFLQSWAQDTSGAPLWCTRCCFDDLRHHQGHFHIFFEVKVVLARHCNPMTPFGYAVRQPWQRHQAWSLVDILCKRIMKVLGLTRLDFVAGLKLPFAGATERHGCSKLTFDHKDTVVQDSKIWGVQCNTRHGVGCPPLWTLSS